MLQRLQVSLSLHAGMSERGSELHVTERGCPQRQDEEVPRRLAGLTRSDVGVPRLHRFEGRLHPLLRVFAPCEVSLAEGDLAVCRLALQMMREVDTGEEHRVIEGERLPLLLRRHPV